MNTRILASLLVIGVVGAFATGSTFALFNDSEESSGNTFTAGAVDLKVDWNETYNGESVQNVSLTDNPGPIFELDDVKPGDTGSAKISLHVYDNPAWMWMRSEIEQNAENTVTEPEGESEAEDNEMGGDFNPDQNGELDDELRFTLWYDEDADGERDDGEEVIYEDVTARELSENTRNGIPLDGDAESDGREAFENSTTQYIGVNWRLPLETGNEVQTDSVEMDFEFFAEQERNNPNPDNPFVAE